MKRGAMIFVILMLLVITACSPIIDTGQSSSPTRENVSSDSTDNSSNDGSSAENTVLFNEELQLREKNIVDILDGSVPYSSIIVTRKNGICNLNIIIKGSDYITDFGKYIILSKIAFEDEFDLSERGDFILSLMDDKSDDMMAFLTGSIGDNKAGVYGLLRDMRSGESKFNALDFEDDLISIFPTTAIFLSESKLDPNDIAIYEEVMTVLNEQYDRSEDEIFAELAPDYGMTADELRKFIRDMMVNIY